MRETGRHLCGGESAWSTAATSPARRQRTSSPCRTNRVEQHGQHHAELLRLDDSACECCITHRHLIVRTLVRKHAAHHSRDLLHSLVAPATCIAGLDNQL